MGIHLACDFDKLRSDIYVHKLIRVGILERCDVTREEVLKRMDSTGKTYGEVLNSIPINHGAVRTYLSQHAALFNKKGRKTKYVSIYKACGIDDYEVMKKRLESI